MPYHDHRNEHDKEVDIVIQGTVRWVIFWVAAIIITVAGLVANHEYEELKRDCPLIVEEMP